MTFGPTALIRLLPNAGLRRSGFTVIELLVSVAVVSSLIALLLPAVQNARGAARRTECSNNMRQLGLSLHGFHETHNSFPASGWTKTGPGNPAGRAVGWRSLVLPFLEQSALSLKYDYASDWWSPQNVAIGATRLSVFQCPATPQRSPVLTAIAKAPRPAMTFSRPLAHSDYEALMGVQPAVHPTLYATAETNRGVLFRNSRIRLGDIRDGASQTILTVECAARPDVYRNRTLRADLTNDQGYGWIDSEGAFSLDGAGPDGTPLVAGSTSARRAVNATNENEPYSFHIGGAFFLFADGHTSFVSENIDLRIVAAWATRSAGEVVSQSP